MFSLRLKQFSGRKMRRFLLARHVKSGGGGAGGGSHFFLQQTLYLLFIYIQETELAWNPPPSRILERVKNPIGNKEIEVLGIRITTTPTMD